LQDFKPRPVTLQDFLSFENHGILAKSIAPLTVTPLPDDRSRIDIDEEDVVEAPP
jgi:hypothetical protein